VGKTRRIGISAVAGLLSMLVVAGSVFAATTVVSPGNLTGWAFFDENPSGGTSSGTFVNGPATPPLGSGSAQLTVNDTGRENLGTLAFAGTRLDQVSALSYAAYKQSGDPFVQVSLQFDVDYNLNDTDTSYQGRLVFEPYQTLGAPVPNGAWQTYDARAGEWWASRAPGNAVCPQSAPCTWSQVLSAFPNAGISGVLLLRAGGPWAGGFVGNADALSITVNGANTTVDFELVVFPTSADQCKKDGWKSFTNATGGPLFKNQGDCVSYVQSGGKNAPSGR